MKKSAGLSNGVSLYRRLLSDVRPFWLAFSLAILGNVLYASTDAAFTYVFKPILDRGFVARDAAFIHWIPILLIGLFIMRAAGNLLSSCCMTWVGRSVVMHYRKRLFHHLLHLPAKDYDSRSAGELLSTLIYNVEQVAGACTDAFTVLVQSGCLVLGLFVVMFLNNWQLTLIFTITIPVIAVIVKYTSLRMRRLSTRIQETIGEVTHIAEEGIDGYKVVRTFSGQAYESAKFDIANKLNRRQEMKVVVTRALGGSAIQMVSAMVLAVLLYIVTMPNTAFTLSAGSFTSMVLAMFAMLKPMKNLTQVNSTIQKGLAAAQSIFVLLDTELEKDTGKKALPHARGSVAYHQVCFGYRDGKSVLQDISFTIEPGQTMAIVGRSGGGKSTLVNLLPRFYDVSAGAILIDGVNIEELTLASLREQIALVSQEVTLFNDTIANNIAYGALRTVATEDIIQAAKAAHAMEFIEQLPQGLATKVGDKGVLLSGGQRQRLAIARALLKNAPILILDEATSALDTTSERIIQQALQALMASRTTLVIAHRLSTVQRADMILVVDRGRIIERGTHQTLLANEGYYASFYKQSRLNDKGI